MKNIIHLPLAKPAKMIKTLIILAFLFSFSFASRAQNQNWRLSSDTLKYPVSIGGGEGTIDYLNKYDTVKCEYKVTGSEKIFNGYKFVFRKNGYYIDDLKTINVFFDEKKQRLEKVYAYTLTE